MRAWEELPYAVGLVAKLPRYLRRPLAVEDARRTVATALGRREDAFLSIARRAMELPVYGRLFAAAGCEPGDLGRSVRRNGVEGTLEALARAGVYLSVDELKGRSPIVRGSASFDAGPASLRNPLASRHIAARTSGSRGAGTHMHFGLEFIRDCAARTLVNLDARNGLRWEKAVWETPGAGALFRLLKYGSFGDPVAHWFTPVNVDASGLNPRYRHAERAVRLASVLSGRPVPRPQSATPSDPLAVARWMARARAAGRVPHVLTFASNAVRLAVRAQEEGIDISGAEVTAVGEPITDAKLATLARAKVSVAPRYGSMETGPIGYACRHPVEADDVHLLADMHAVVQPGARHALPPEALLVTSLLTSSPYSFLNVSMGDEGVLDDSACGCPVEAIGWRRRLRHVRSFEKLTGGGVTFLGSDVIRVLEEALPTRFGGSPTDYQLVESETADGLPHITLVVDPRVGPLVEVDVKDAFLAAIAPGDGGERLMGIAWAQGGVVSVERRAPAVTATGKFQHLVLKPAP